MQMLFNNPFGYITKYQILCTKVKRSFSCFLPIYLMYYLSAIERIPKLTTTKKSTEKNHAFNRCSSWRQESMTFDIVKIYAL